MKLGQPNSGDAERGGKQTRQRRNGSALPWSGSGKQDGEVYECTNQWSNPRKWTTDSNLADLGRLAARVCRFGGGQLPCGLGVGRPGGHGECLRRSRGEAAREELGAHPVERSVVNVGTAIESPCLPVSQTGSGQSRRRRMTWWRGGALVVVRGRESRLHREGEQPVRSERVGMPGGRR